MKRERVQDRFARMLPGIERFSFVKDWIVFFGKEKDEGVSRERCTKVNVRRWGSQWKPGRSVYNQIAYIYSTG